MAGTQAGIEIPHFLAGDIILFSGQNDLYSRFGRWLMRGRGETPTFAVHTAQFLNPRRVMEMDALGRVKTLDDILNKRVRIEPWKRRGFEVWRCTTLTPEQRKALTHHALAFLNLRFGYVKSLGFLLDALLSRLARREIYIFRRLLSDGYPVCSEITSVAYDRALGYRFGVPPECADPDNIHDWLVGHPDEWVRIYSLEDYSLYLSAIRAPSPVATHAGGN